MLRRSNIRLPRGAFSKRERLAARLRDDHGFMLAEQLVSIVFIGLLCIAVAAGLGAAISAYGAVTTASNANMLLSETVQQVSDELAFSVSAEDGTASFVSAATRTSVTMESGTEGIVLAPSGSSGAGAPVVLVAVANGLTPSFDASPTYRAATNDWTYTVVVKDESGHERARQQMVVARLNPPGT